jgi:hypothetical protein
MNCSLPWPTTSRATEELARESQEQERTTAERVWKFLPSRSKIAFNMLNLQEVDPSVETRAIENRST